ncbi:hypothetical protein HYC85_013661, partial [Camellia sinensis]
HVKTRCFKLHPELRQCSTRPHGPGTPCTTALVEAAPAPTPAPSAIPNLQELQTQIGQLQVQLGSLASSHGPLPSTAATLATGTSTAFHVGSASPTWVLDSAANGHMTGEFYFLFSPVPTTIAQFVCLADGSSASVQHKVSASPEFLPHQKKELLHFLLQIASIRNAHDQAQSELNLFRSKMECDTQISCIPGEQQELQHKLSETNLERKKMENEVKRMEMEQKSCSLKVKKLIEKHAWITLEKHRFRKSGTDYDFASRDPHTAREDFEKLQAEQSDDFGSIFSTLLPGTMAKLEMPEGSSFLDGLEVCVAFGSVWKQSLSKLSGGQRSLLALSLILALLLLKPAPLYILDEFFVVSLKEGMFNNANVLFRTMFVDGVSTVQRTVASKPNK